MRIRSIVPAGVCVAFALAGFAAAAASTFSVAGSGNQFIVSRSGEGTNYAETVRYRTVSLSAYAGQHYTANYGTLAFAAGQTTTNVSVTGSTPSNNAYKYQTGASRSYRFEITDIGGFPITNAVRSITTGTQLSTTYLNREVSDLVYFTSGGSITSGSGNKYLDVTYGPSSYRQVTDGGYNQAVHTVGTGSLYGNNADLRTFLDGIGCKMYATVYFTQKEEQDGYQYIQILADNATTYDGNDPNGAVDTPSTSIYKACFILSYTPSGSVMEDDHYQFFPHRYDYADKAAETSASVSHYEFDYNNSHLYEQKFRNNTPSYRTSTSGSLVLATSVNNLNIRFDAAGSGGDTWDFKNLKVRLALVDTASPVKLTASAAAAPGVHAKGNDLYVSVAFNEPVTCSSASLTTTWGTLSHNSGSGSNVLTFKGKISASASGNLNITSWSGTIKDLAGNELAGSGALNQSNLASLTGSYVYTISYDLAGGALPGGSASNPTTYTYESDGITLANPVRTGYNFVGWTGTGITSPTNSVTIPAGSHGDRSYVAHWDTIPWAGTGTSVDPYVIIYPSQLDLLAAQVNAGDEFQNTYFVLGTNITYAYTTAWNDATSTENNYTAIGGSVGCFKGVFDGRGYTVSGIRIYKCGSGTADGKQGLFGRTSDGTVRNVTIADARITGSSSVGGIVGEAYRGEVSNCFVLDVALPDVEKSGAIVGYNNNATLAANYYHACTVAGTANAIGVGTGDGDVAGALPVFTVGGNDIAVAGTSAVAHDGTNYYVEGSVVTLSYTGELPAGATCGYVASAGILDGDSLTLPAADVTVTAYVMTGLTVNGRDVGFPSGPGWYSDGAHTVYLTNAGPFTVSGSTASGYGIEATTSAQVILSNATIDASAYEDCIAFRVASGASVDFSLIGSNTLKTSDGNSGLQTGRAALEVPEGASATIGGEGSLSATAGTASGNGGGAGIGGGCGQNAGTIEIRGGTITALSRNSGAGIGGGTGGNGGTITISGGVVNAQGRQSGIGGGYQGHGGNITISGGTVYASSTVDNRPDIGGMANSEAASCIISGGSVHAVNGRINPAAENANHVAVHCVTVSGLPADTEQRISWLTTADSGYGQNDMRTDSNGKLYVWLPDGTYYFTVDGAGFRAVVDGADTAAESGLVVPYVDENGDVQICFGCTVITNAVGDVLYGASGQENWYVVRGDVTISGNLGFDDDCAHLIICDYATLAVTNVSGDAIKAWRDIAIYGQSYCTGAVVANGSGTGIFAVEYVTINGSIVSATGSNGIVSRYSVTINGGRVTANGVSYGISGGGSVTINGGTVSATATGDGGSGIIVHNGDIALGWSDLADSITASSYGFYHGNGTLSIKEGQIFTDGVDSYAGVVDPAAIAGKTLMPCLSPWKLLQKQLDAGGMVKLAGDVAAEDNDDATLTVTNAVTLDLNGHTIDADYRFRAIQVLEGGDLVLTNSVEGAGAIVNGQDMRYGGGVYVENGAFTMSGGSICSNIAQQGCGVYVDGRRGSFTMTGGEISGNRPPISSSTMVSGYNGGGVYMKGGMFEMSGGSIADNNAGFNGGGVYMQGGTFTMSGGSVTNNYAPQNGGGVYMDGGTFTISSGEISGNIARYSGGGVFMYNTGSGDGTFTMSGGEISGNVAYANGVDNPRGGGGVFVSGGYEGFVMTGGTIISNSVQSSSSAYGGGVCVYGSATNTISGGMISGNFVTTTAGGNVWTFGGGVFVDKSTFAMTGGEISGNWSSKSGGGVCVRGDAIHLFMMSGGAISGNAAYCIGMNGLGGGGVFVNSGVFEMSGGEISGNTAVGGGGVYVNNNSTFAMTNSVISGNEASKGGGVYVNSGHLYVSGVSSVSGNTNSVGAANNVYLPSGKKIGVGDLSAGASIGVTTQTEPTLANPVAFASGSAADGAHFFSDDPGFAVCVENNSLCLRAITPWERLQKRLDAGGMVKLASDVTATNDDATLMVANAVTLDLSGHVIDADGWFRVIEVLEGGNLTLTNSVEGAGAVIGGCDVYYGGGVYVHDGGAFMMAGGTIFANSANRGGGVYVDGGTIEISGGEISGNTAYGNGGGVYVTGSAFTISGGKISGNVVGPSSGTMGGGGVYVYGSSNSDRSTFTMTGGEISGNVVYASGSTDVYGGGGVYVNENGTFAMSGGSIISNSVQSSGRAYGGGVCLKNIIGTGTMTGGTISGNFVDTTGDGNNIYAAGGGMFVNKCAFTMSGGEISGNWSSKNGGGVAVGGIGYAFVMTGGEISGNTAKCLGWYNCYGGGGVYVNNSATFAMTNSVVSGNVASKGGGVYVNVGTLRVSGSSVVSGNTNSVGQSRNVYLASSRTITVEGLAAGASIGVQTATEPTLGNSVKFATGALAGEEEYFFSDIYGYDVRLNGSDLLLAQLMAFPTYLEGADNSVRSNYVSWAARNGEDSNSEHEDAFLLNVAPEAVPAELSIVGIEVDGGGATVRVAASAGGEAVDMERVNGVFCVEAGENPVNLVPKAVQAGNVAYGSGEAQVFVPASDGSFIRVSIDTATPAR